MPRSPSRLIMANNVSSHLQEIVMFDRQPTLITRRHTLWLLAGLTGSLAVHGCTHRQNQGNISAAVGLTPWIGYVPLYIALGKGFFTSGGLDLNFNVFGSPTEMNAAFLGGQLQGMGAVTSEVLTLSDRGQDHRIVLVADTSAGADGILARNSIENIADFQGKEIAVERGSVSHYFLLQVLNEAGLSPDDVTIVNTTPDAAAAAYQAGRTDIAVTYSPFLQKANSNQPDGRIIYDSSKMPTAVVDVYTFGTPFVESHPEAMQSFVNGIAAGLEFLETDRQEALAIAARELELTPEEVETELQGVKLTSMEANQEMLADRNSDIYLGKQLQTIGSLLAELGQIDAPPTDVDRFIDPQFVV